MVASRGSWLGWWAEPGEGQTSDLLGLDDVVLAAYRMWLRQEDLSVEAVGAALRQPPSTIRRIRDWLVETCLLQPSRDRPGHLVAVHPEAPLDRLIEAQHTELLRRHERLLRARAQTSSFVSEFVSSRPGLASGRDVTHVPDVDALQAELVTLVGGAEREVLAVRTRRVVGRRAEQILPVQLGALRRGVMIRIVLPGPHRPEDGDDAGVLAVDGAQVRVADDDTGVDVTVVDRRVSLLRLASEFPASGGLLIRAPSLTALATALFDRLWRAAQPLPVADSPEAGARDPQPGGPSEQERLLLRLLGDGVKDEAAARALGVSVRTVRRMIADLMRRLDARSRFQAGIMAIQRGWF
jgi:DNA-binding CsgD family transcriptional regulator